MSSWMDRWRRWWLGSRGVREGAEGRGSYVDPRDAWRDAEGREWHALVPGQAWSEAERSGFASEGELAQARRACRYLARQSAYAKNGHENRISYVVGTGHTYQAIARHGRRVDEACLSAVQTYLDAWCEANQWRKRQQEIMRRLDRDGEAFVRLFPRADGMLLIRFVEPCQVATPASQAHDPSAAMGVLCDAQDAERVLGYYVDGELVDADQIQHRKANVDLNVRRGSPLFWPVLTTLGQVQKVRRNMAYGSSLQTSVAYVKSVVGGTSGTVTALRAAAADDAPSAALGPRGETLETHRPGRILTKTSNLSYDFPWSSVRYSQYVEVIQDSLREVASLLVMPEFMLTSDASNANYSSTLVAEGPAVKMFERLQADLAQDDLWLLRRALAHAVACGVLPPRIESDVEIQVGKPSVRSRDALAEVRADQVLFQSRILSAQTFAARQGLDYRQEQANLLAAARVAPRG